MAFSTVCPCCGAEWDYQPRSLGLRRRDWGSLAFRCHRCGVGYSNATDPSARVRIVRSPLQAVPQEVHAGLEDALTGSLNVRNRPSKRSGFCSANSEDAATWTFFDGLALSGLLDAVRVASGFDDHPPMNQPDVLLWGVPIAGADGDNLRSALMADCDAMGETPTGRTEPDVILVAETIVIFIEVKTGLSNQHDATAGGFPRYLQDESRFAVPGHEVQANGYYELTRNWVIGNRFADGQHRDFALLNLGPPALARGAEKFSELVASSPHRGFKHLTWEQLLHAAGPLPAWLQAYVDDRALGSDRPRAAPNFGCPHAT